MDALRLISQSAVFASIRLNDLSSTSAFQCLFELLQVPGLVFFLSKHFQIRLFSLALTLQHDLCVSFNDSRWYARLNHECATVNLHKQSGLRNWIVVSLMIDVSPSLFKVHIPVFLIQRPFLMVQSQRPGTTLIMIGVR